MIKTTNKDNHNGVMKTPKENENEMPHYKTQIKLPISMEGTATA